MEKLISDITQWYDLQTEIFRTGLRFEKTQELLKQQTWELRTKNQAEKMYPGSLRSFIDRITGKGSRLEALQREAREARAQFEKTTWDWKVLTAKNLKLQEQCDALPSPEDLKAAAMAQPETAKFWARKEALLCAEMLQPLLESNHAALLEYRAQLQGARMGEVVSRQKLHEIGTAHIQWGLQCGDLLHRIAPAMELLKIPFKIPGYFCNPSGYIVSAAAQHNRLDRMNKRRYGSYTKKVVIIADL